MLSIIGFAHFKGVSKKTGKDYDFYQVHCISEDKPRGFTGDAVEVVSVNADDFESNNLSIGSVFDLTRHGRVFVQR